MSGYVLTIKFAKTDDDRVIRSLFIKRYFRLMPPVLASTLVAYVLMRSGLMNNAIAPLSSWYRSLAQVTPDLRGAVFEGAWTTFVSDDFPNYNAPVWTMHIEFLGSLMCFALCLLTQRSRFYGLVYAATIAGLLTALQHDGPYFALFVVGNWLARIEMPRIRAPKAALLIIIGMWLGGYHDLSTFHAPLRMLHILAPNSTTPAVCFSLAAVIIFVAILQCESMSGFFSRFQLIGKLSFSLYLIHFPILLTVGGYVFSITRAHGMNYPISAASTCVIIISLSYIASTIFHRLVDARAISLSERVLRFASKSSETKIKRAIEG
jgi:peptidoglycan/LPS O-acetylase OafA/YrhL